MEVSNGTAVPKHRMARPRTPKPPMAWPRPAGSLGGTISAADEAAREAAATAIENGAGGPPKGGVLERSSSKIGSSSESPDPPILRQGDLVRLSNE